MNSDPWCSNDVACILPITPLESLENIRQTKTEEHSTKYLGGTFLMWKDHERLLGRN